MYVNRPVITLAAATLGAAAVTIYRLRQQVAAASQADIEAFVAHMHTHLAMADELDAAEGAAQGWVTRAETPPPGAGPWYWHAAVVGHPDARYSMRTVDWRQGWARTRRAACNQRDTAITTLVRAVATGTTP